MTSGIIEILIEDTGVRTEVGLNKAGEKYKVYPMVCPEGEEQPYVIVSMVSNDAQTSMDKTDASLLDYPQYNVICYAKNFRKTETIHAACRAALDDKESVTDAGAEFERIWLANEKDGFDNGAQLYAKIATYRAEVKR
jgi:hypothetical protein